MSSTDVEVVDLVRRAIVGDASAFGALYDRYLERVYRYVYYRVGSVEEAEDLSEEIFLKAWEAIGRYREQGVPFSAWLMRLAHNHVIDHFRTRRVTAPLAETLPARTPDPEHAAERRLAAQAVLCAMQDLTSEQQQVLILRFIEEFDHSEIAAIMGKNEGAVRALQFRGLSALRAALARDGE
ncbi:MAG: sigma-70 family RNA polymerase sigma factor [Chloroflexi bacterium]|nr:sigma-70 family RNA polymerase sigma factor [Chloroflexota bacterium]